MSEVGWTTQTPVTQFIDDYTCVGKVCPNTQIKVIDDQGHSLPANTNGQICIGGPQVIELKNIWLIYYFLIPFTD